MSITVLRRNHSPNAARRSPPLRRLRVRAHTPLHNPPPSRALQPAVQLQPLSLSRVATRGARSPHRCSIFFSYARSSCFSRRADPNVPHIHKGALEPFKQGPLKPGPTPSEEAQLAAGKTVMKSIRLPGQGGRAVAIFDVPVPPSIVWDGINDITSYPKMVSGVSSVQIYSGPSTSSGVTRTKAKWTLSFLGYKVCVLTRDTAQGEQRALTLSFGLR